MVPICPYVLNFNGFKYTGKTEFTLKESKNYLKNPLKQRLKSWLKILMTLLFAKNKRSEAEEVVFLPFTKTQSNLFLQISKNFPSSSFFLFDDLFSGMRKNLEEKGQISKNYTDCISRKNVLGVVGKWIRTPKPKNTEASLYLKIRKRIIFLDLFRQALTNYLKNTKAKIIIVPEDRSDLSQIAISVARKLNIKSVSFQHGLYSDKKIKNWYHKKQDLADLHLVYGEHFWNEFVKNGVGLRKVKVVGAPQYEYLRMSPNPKNVLYASQIHPQREKALKLLSTLDSQNLKIIDKLHPAENNQIKVHKDLLSDTEISILKKGSIEKMLTDTKVLLTINSTVFFGAVVLGIPIGFFTQPAVNLGNYHIGKVINSEKELKKFIADAFSGRLKFNSGQKRFIKDYVGPYKKSNELIKKYVNKLK